MTSVRGGARDGGESKKLSTLDAGLTDAGVKIYW